MQDLSVANKQSRNEDIYSCVKEKTFQMKIVQPVQMKHTIGDIPLRTAKISSCNSARKPQTVELDKIPIGAELILEK